MRRQLRLLETRRTNTRRVSEGQPDYGTLPTAVWHVILRYLDVESRLAVVELGPSFGRLVFGKECMATVRCGVNTEAAALSRLLLGGCAEHLRTLDLTNCVVAVPGALLSCITCCRQLTDLRCVGCPLEPLLLVNAVSRWLTRLERLDWSLYYRESLREALEEVAQGKPSSLLPPAYSLARMYVEVEYSALPSQVFLGFFFDHCPNIRHLQVHVVRSAHAGSAAECARIGLSGRLPRLISCTFSTDEDALQDREGSPEVLERATRLYADFNAWGNVTFGCQSRQPTNCLRLEELVSDQRVHHFQQLAVVMSSSSSADPELLERAATQQYWSHVQCLTLIREPERTDDPTAPHILGPVPTFGATLSFDRGLRTLFSVCRSMAELNMNTFHVSSSRNFLAEVLASGPSQLRAISVTVCALADNHLALDQLAANCPRLQELDVRSAYPSSCFACSYGVLALNATSPGVRCLMNSLERITLFNVQRLKSLDFTSALCVSELRLFNVNMLSTSASEQLGDILRSNPNLRSLTLAHDELSLGSLRENLARTCLRFVCLQTRTAVSREQAQRFADDLQLALPLLFSLHVHFACIDGQDELRITWVRLSHGGFPVYHSTQRQFIMLEDAPCVQCHASTFVGLAKPRNRDWCRL